MPEQLEQPQPQPKHQPAEYKYIAAFGRYVGHFANWITEEQSRASAENAPLDAIYKSEAGWKTVNHFSPYGQERLKELAR